MAYVPESQDDDRYNYNDYGLEATQLSQPVKDSQQASQFPNSQIEPRRKYCELSHRATAPSSRTPVMQLLMAGALFIPTNPHHAILKVPWTKHVLQIGRGGHAEVGNDVVLAEKRVSNRHCRISLGLKELREQRFGMSEEDILEELHEREEAPDVWIEDMRSSNGTFVSLMVIR